MQPSAQCAHVEQGVAGVDNARGAGFTRMDDAWQTCIKGMFEWVKSHQEYQDKHFKEDWDATK